MPPKRATIRKATTPKRATKPPATTVPDEAWYAKLDAAWKAVFAEQCDVTSPAKVKKLAAVKEIYLDDACAVTSLAPLARLAKLTELNCEATRVVDLTPLAQLPKLASLRITSPIADFGPLAKLTALTSLDLTDSSIADLTPLAKLAKLEQLSLDDTPVADLAPIAGLKKVERLELARTKVSDLGPIAGWKKLTDLVLSRCPIESIESFDVLARIPELHSLDVSHTRIASLAPIDRQVRIHILDVTGTAVSFAELLRYRQARGVKRDALLRLDVYSDFTELESFLAALATLDSTRGVEPVLTAWINDVLLGLLRSKTEAHRAPALLERWFALGVAPNEYTKEIAGNAVHLIVTQAVDASLERRVLDELVPQATMDRLLAFNLACYHARRGNKPAMLQHARLALEQGQEAASFRTDEDFAAFRDDVELAAIVATNFTPDPYQSPMAWWRSLPEDLRAAFWVDGEDEAAIREMLDGLEDLQLDGVRSLDPLRGLRIQRLFNRECKASSLEIVATFPGLEELHWEKNQYLGGTRLTDLSPLANATTLRVLKMPGHLFTNVDAVAGLVELTELDVRESPLESLEGVRALTKLEVLSVDAKVPLDLSPLEGLQALSRLWLHGPVVSFEPIAKLRSLTHLWIQRCTLADGTPVPLTPLHRLSKLQHVWVGNDRAAAVKQELKKVLPKCKVA